MEAIVNSVKKSFSKSLTLDVKWRREQLKNLLRLLSENEKELVDALKKDLNKHHLEASVFEFNLIKTAINHSLSHLDEWMKPVPADPPVQLKLTYKTYVQKQPYGTVLIMGAWNYPYQLT